MCSLKLQSIAKQPDTQHYGQEILTGPHRQKYHTCNKCVGCKSQSTAKQPNKHLYEQDFFPW